MPDAGIRVRSYNVGFGDCFLVTVPDGAATRHILIDFGNAPGQLNDNYPAIAETTSSPKPAAISTSSS